ncbi:hypothetical protein FO519_005750 [Halicephalobus sp. NKZ332]|nr:hypothetical protein FO519_005750 [Halicephalobus sp. NKZ332]
MIAVAGGIFVGPITFQENRIDKFKEFLLESLKLKVVKKDEPEISKTPQKLPLKRRRTMSVTPGFPGPPWEGLKVDTRINENLEELFILIIENYINKWYKAEINSDTAFIGEIQYQIRYACSLILKEIKDFDSVSFLLEKLVPIAVMHVDRFCSELKKNSDEPPPVLEMKILNQMEDLHIAMTSRENEMDYLRITADFLVERLVDESRVGGRADDFENPTPGFVHKSRPWPSHCVRHLLREIVLSTILIPLLDFISNPDTLNGIFLTALEPSPAKIQTDEPKKTKTSRFLAQLTEFGNNDAPDSLLALKLNDVVREPRLLQLFYMYLHDVRGPAHFLDCFLQARDLHNDLHKCADSNDKLFEELHSDAWQLFSDYIHESAPHRINFENEQIPEDFHKAVDFKDRNLIKKVAEDVYKEMYHRLNYPYVVPFCQSECYLGYLCGAPPDVVELIRGQDEEDKKAAKPLPESSQQNPEEIGEKEVLEEVEEIEAAEALTDLGRDLNKWIVTIPRVEPRKDISGRVYYIYVISIERLDVVSPESNSENFGEINLPSNWTITRKFDEFHILEQKLKEFHGNSLRLGILPDKKIFHQKNRTFMDSQRIQFERFIQSLLLQPVLKKSELLYAFLTTEEEIREDQPFVSDLNPFRVMRKVPGKLQRERGQNLKPFLLNVLANILAPTSYYAESPILAKEVNSDQSSLRSFSSDKDTQAQVSSKIALDNLMLTQKRIQEDFQEQTRINPPWLQDPVELMTFFLIRIGGFTSSLFLSILNLVSKFFDRVIDIYAKKKTRETLEYVLNEENLIYIIQSLQKSIINGTPESTEEEKRLRAELTQRRFDEFFEEYIPRVFNGITNQKGLRQVIHNVVKAAQFPRLNKQLAFVILDVIVDEARRKTFDFPVIPDVKNE